MVSFAEVSEGIRFTLAAHAHANDDGRTNDMVALYTPDAVLEVPGGTSYEGTETLKSALAGFLPLGPQCHMTINTVIHSWNAEAAEATSDVVFVGRDGNGWSVQSVLRLHDRFRNVDGHWLIQHRRPVPKA